MVDPQIVCCMCGDKGFSDKLFRCSKCHNRFQHSYCSDYYREKAEAIEVCDWCRCEEEKNSTSRQSAAGSSSPRNGMLVANGNEPRQPNSGDKTKRQEGKAHSPRQITTRRYKLLKDVIS